MAMVLQQRDAGQLGSLKPGAQGSLMFSMEVEDAAAASSSLAKDEEQASMERLQTLLQSQQPGHFPEQLQQDVQTFRRAIVREEERCDCVSLAARLSAVGYAVKVRQSLGGSSAGVGNVPGACFRNLTHTFLHVRCTQPGNEYQGVELLVEPAFREQFQVSHPSPRYSGLLAAVPEAFVGTNARLVPLVQLLCNEMALSFEQQGLTLPPWRRTNAMLSKWMPARARDIAISSSSGSSPAGASPVGPSPPTDATVMQSSPETSSSPVRPAQPQARQQEQARPNPLLGWLESAQLQREQAMMEAQLAMQFANLAAHNARTASPEGIVGGLGSPEPAMLLRCTTGFDMVGGSSGDLSCAFVGASSDSLFARRSEPLAGGNSKPAGMSPRGPRSLLSLQLNVAPPQPPVSVPTSGRVQVTVVPGQPPIHKVRLGP